MHFGCIGYNIKLVGLNFHENQPMLAFTGLITKAHYTGTGSTHLSRFPATSIMPDHRKPIKGFLLQNLEEPASRFFFDACGIIFMRF